MDWWIYFLHKWQETCSQICLYIYVWIIILKENIRYGNNMFIFNKIYYYKKHEDYSKTVHDVFEIWVLCKY